MYLLQDLVLLSHSKWDNGFTLSAKTLPAKLLRARVQQVRKEYPLRTSMSLKYYYYCSVFGVRQGT